MTERDEKHGADRSGIGGAQIGRPADEPGDSGPHAGTGVERRRRGALLASLIAAAVLLAAGLITGVMLMNANRGPDGGHSADHGTSGAGGSDNSGSAGGADSGGADTGSGAAGDLPGGASQVLPRAMSGQEAIDALGDDIGVVAERNGMSVEELERTLLANPSAKVSKTGFLMLP